ncbi:hypothetical protein [Gracilimonas sp.]|uniref:hypothetical protein n=1 Tax=Gracilimonas sp. TaxID=1974203 RepID=UPI002870BF8E|nr:hypothetical protein [Gracilimonas sp.]
MSLNSTYHKITGYTTLIVLLWNIVGWLGFGLVIDHTHKHSKEHHCEVTFCFCEIEEGETICTCHHNDMNKENAHSDDHDNEFCYFSSSHSDSNTASQSLIVIAKFNALYLSSEDLPSLTDMHEFNAEKEFMVLSGTVPDLLRPPRG